MHLVHILQDDHMFSLYSMMCILNNNLTAVTNRDGNKCTQIYPRGGNCCAAVAVHSTTSIQIFAVLSVVP